MADRLGMNLSNCKTQPRNKFNIKKPRSQHSNPNLMRTCGVKESNKPHERCDLGQKLTFSREVFLPRAIGRRGYRDRGLLLCEEVEDPPDEFITIDQTRRWWSAELALPIIEETVEETASIRERERKSCRLCLNYRLHLRYQNPFIDRARRDCTVSS